MIPVMIVEDEFLVRVGLRSIIEWERFGFRVVADASSAEKGLELYRAHRPYLILTDIRMSPMDGLEMMRIIREEDKQVHFIVISAYSEFQYAQEAIRHGVDLYLDKAGFTGADIEGTLAKIREEFEGQGSGDGSGGAAAERLPELLASLPDEGDAALEPWFGRVGLGGCVRRIAVCRQNRSRARAVNAHALSAIVSELLEGAGITHALYHYKGFIAALLDGTNPEAVREGLDRICRTSETYIGAQVRCGLSAPIAGAHTLRLALSEACQACNGAIFACNRPDAAAQSPQQVKAYEEAVTAGCQEVSLLLQAGNGDEAVRQMRELTLGAPSYRALEKTLLALVLMLEGLDPAIDVMELLFELLQIDDMEEICGRLARTMEGLEMSGADSPHYIDSILQYISGHLDADLSLKTLAAQFHISPNYLGKLFYQRTGVYLSGYVHNCRIGEACELLRGTTHTVSEIGRIVGIENPHYFSKLFKDKMGVSPQQYRGRLTAANR